MRGGFPIKSFYHNMDFGFSNTTRWNISERTVFNYTTNNYYGGGYSSGFGNSCGGGNFWSGFGMGLGNALGNLLGGFSMGFGNFGMGSFGMGGFGFGNWGNSFWGNNTPTTPASTTTKTVVKEDADYAKLNELQSKVNAMNTKIDKKEVVTKEDYDALVAELNKYVIDKTVIDDVNKAGNLEQAKLILESLRKFPEDSPLKQDTSVTSNDNSDNSTEPARKDYGTIINSDGYESGFSDYDPSNDASLVQTAIIRAHEVNGPMQDVTRKDSSTATVVMSNDGNHPKEISITTGSGKKFEYEYYTTDNGRYIYKSKNTNNYYLLQKKGSEFHLMQYEGMTGYGNPDSPSKS